MSLNNYMLNFYKFCAEYVYSKNIIYSTVQRSEVIKNKSYFSLLVKNKLISQKDYIQNSYKLYALYI